MQESASSYYWTDERSAEITRLWSSPLSILQIAQEMGITKNMAMSKIRRLGLPSRRSHEKKFYGLNIGQDLARRERSCMFPMGEPGQPDFAYCGEAVTKRDYCQFHNELCYVPAKRKPGPPSDKTTMVYSALQGRMVPKRMAGAK